MKLTATDLSPDSQQTPHVSVRFFPIKKKKLFFNWRKISWQCCVGFCYTATQFSPSYAYVPSLWSVPPLPQPTPLGHHRAPGWASCVKYQLVTNCLFYTWCCVYMLMPLSPFVCTPIWILGCRAPDLFYQQLLQRRGFRCLTSFIKNLHIKMFKTYRLFLLRI